MTTSPPPPPSLSRVEQKPPPLGGSLGPCPDWVPVLYRPTGTVEVQPVDLGPGTAQCLSAPPHTQAQPRLPRWLMDVSDPSGCIERPQDVWAGGPPDRAKMEA